MFRGRILAFTKDLGVLTSFSVVSAVFADLIVLPVLLMLLKPLGSEIRLETEG